MSIIPDEVKIACLLAPITPATIKQITIEDAVGRYTFNFSQKLGNL